MNSPVEDRIRAATRAAAGTVRSVRPLELPEPSVRHVRRARWARHWSLWMAPAAAALAVAVIAVSVVLIKNGPNGSSRLPASPPPATSGVPPYYVALTGRDDLDPRPQVMVGDTYTGKRLATLRAPRGQDFATVTPGQDDRTFVLGSRPAPVIGKPLLFGATRWYLVRLRPGASGTTVTATMRELPVRVPESVTATALSPDGTRLAVASQSGGVGQPGTKPKPLTLRLRIYSTATGKVLREWSGTIPQWQDSVSLLTWTDGGRQIAIDLSGSPRLEVRLLRAGNSGHDLFADSRLAWSVPEPSTYYVTREHPFTCGTWGAPDPLITPDGQTIVCGASSIFAKPTVNPGGGQCGGPAWSSGGVMEYSAATGKLTRALYRYESNCLPESALGPVAPLWTSNSGDTVLAFFDFGYRFRFGVIRQGTFTSLPLPPALAEYATRVTIAW